MTREEAEELWGEITYNAAIIMTYNLGMTDESKTFTDAEQSLKQAKSVFLSALAPEPVTTDKPGKYRVTREVTQECTIRKGEDGNLWVRHINDAGVSVGWSLPLASLVKNGAKFYPVEER